MWCCDCKMKKLFPIRTVTEPERILIKYFEASKLAGFNADSLSYDGADNGYSNQQEGYYDTRDAVKDALKALSTYHQSQMEEVAKAYGGCTNCYGKGYSTYQGEYKARQYRWQDKKMKFCDCERGKQLESQMEEREAEIRIDESKKVYGLTVNRFPNSGSLDMNIRAWVKDRELQLEAIKRKRGE